MGNVFKQTLKIEYWWKRDDGGEMSQCQEDVLAEDALERITTLLSEGYTSGTLNADINVPEEFRPPGDPEDGVAFSGWWSIETVPNTKPRVVFFRDDLAKHEDGCECGDCDSNGRSFGVGIYEIPNSITSVEAAIDWANEEGEIVTRIYASTEAAALDMAKEEALNLGYEQIFWHKIFEDVEA